MKAGKDPGQETDDGDMLRLAVDYFERVLKELDATLGELEAREAVAPAKAKTQVVDVRKALQIVFEERHRLDRLLDTTDDTCTATGLDLEQARTEIGRQLDRLRAALAAGGAAGGAE